MNDTMSIWHEVWMCNDDRPDMKHYDLTIVAFSATFLAIVICMFYLGSYIQVENAQRHSVRCMFELLLPFKNLQRFFFRLSSSTASRPTITIIELIDSRRHWLDAILLTARLITANQFLSLLNAFHIKLDTQVENKFCKSYLSL